MLEDGRRMRKESEKIKVCSAPSVKIYISSVVLKTKESVCRKHTDECVLGMYIQWGSYGRTEYTWYYILCFLLTKSSLLTQTTNHIVTYTICKNTHFCVIVWPGWWRFGSDGRWDLSLWSNPAEIESRWWHMLCYHCKSGWRVKP